MFWHTSVGQAHSFRGWRILPAFPVCIYYDLLDFMASSCLFSPICYLMISSDDVCSRKTVPLQGDAARLRLLSLSQLCRSLTSYILFCPCDFGSCNPSGTLELFKYPLCWGEQPLFSCFFLELTYSFSICSGLEFQRKIFECFAVHFGCAYSIHGNCTETDF